jgi:hypothetical protein
MHFQFEVAPTFTSAVPEYAPPPASTAESTALLRQILEVQREHLQLQRAAAASHDVVARWRACLGRWEGDFPDLAASCKHVVPTLERVYLRMIRDLVDQLHDVGDGVENEFVLTEFLDRYGMRLGQLSTIVTLLAPLAEAGARPEE